MKNYHCDISAYTRYRTKYKILSHEEEYQLFDIYKKSKDRKAFDKIIMANVLFVIKVAMNYKNTPVPLADLVGEGIKGLIKAAKRFDHTRGLKFISYANWWIRSKITKHLNEKASLIKIPSNEGIKIRKYEREGKELPVFSKKLKRLTEDASLSVKTNGTSLENYLHSKENTEDIINEKDIKSVIMEVLDYLDEREKKIIEKYYGIGQPEQTLREISESDDINITRERIRQIKAKALKKSKKYLKKIESKI